MAVDITALYLCLDDFCKAFADWEAHRLIPSPTTRQRSGKLSRSEMLLIVVLFHLSPYKHFKAFYLYGIGRQHLASAGSAHQPEASWPSEGRVHPFGHHHTAQTAAAMMRAKM